MPTKFAIIAATILSCVGTSHRTLVAQSGSRDALPLQLFVYDRSAPLDISARVYQQRDDMTIYDISYVSPKGGRVPGYLTVPTAPGPHAGILIQHGLPGSREDMFRLLTTLARTGAVTLAITAPWARPEIASTRDTILAMTPRDAEEQIQLVIDWMRGVDLLRARLDVDPERLAYVGVSYGGMIGGLLAGVERRVKAYVLIVGDGGLATHMKQGDNPDWARLTQPQRDAWLAAMEPIEPIRFIPYAAPAVLLLQNGRRDEQIPMENALTYQQAASNPKWIYWYDTGHTLNSQSRFDMTNWLAMWIGLNPARLQP